MFIKLYIYYCLKYYNILMFHLIYLTVNSLVHNCPRRTMATKEFEKLALYGSNYSTWASDIEIALASRGLLATI